MNNEALNKALSDIDEIARNVCSYDYGLPIHDAGQMALMREALRAALAETPEGVGESYACFNCDADGFGCYKPHKEKTNWYLGHVNGESNYACELCKGLLFDPVLVVTTPPSVDALIAEAVAKEREACIADCKHLADQYPVDLWPESGESIDCKSAKMARLTASNIAEAIRASSGA